MSTPPISEYDRDVQLRANTHLMEMQTDCIRSLTAQRTWLTNWRSRACDLFRQLAKQYDIGEIALVNEVYKGDELTELSTMAVSYRLADNVVIKKWPPVLANVWVLMSEDEGGAAMQFPSAEAAFAYFQRHPAEFLRKDVDNLRG